MMDFEKANELINEIQILESELRFICGNAEALAEGKEGLLAGVVLKLLDSAMTEINRLKQPAEPPASYPIELV